MRDMIPSANPSPSGDTWWDDPRNVTIVEEGIADLKAGRMRAYSQEEILQLLGLCQDHPS